MSEQSGERGHGRPTSLRIADPSALTEYLHASVSEGGRLVLEGLEWQVVRSRGRLFYIRGDGAVDLGGPFTDMPDLVRREGRLRRRDQADGHPEVEVFEWDGWFYRIVADDWDRFPDRAAATSPRSRS